MKYSFYAFLLICVVYKLPVWAIVVYLFAIYILRVLNHILEPKDKKIAPAATKQTGTRQNHTYSV